MAEWTGESGITVGGKAVEKAWRLTSAEMPNARSGTAEGLHDKFNVFME